MSEPPRIPEFRYSWNATDADIRRFATLSLRDWLRVPNLLIVVGFCGVVALILSVLWGSAWFLLFAPFYLLILVGARFWASIRQHRKVFAQGKTVWTGGDATALVVGDPGGTCSVIPWDRIAVIKPLDDATYLIRIDLPSGRRRMMLPAALLPAELLELGAARAHSA